MDPDDEIVNLEGQIWSGPRVDVEMIKDKEAHMSPNVWTFWVCKAITMNSRKGPYANMKSFKRAAAPRLRSLSNVSIYALEVGQWSLFQFASSGGIISRHLTNCYRGGVRSCRQMDLYLCIPVLRNLYSLLSQNNQSSGSESSKSHRIGWLSTSKIYFTTKSIRIRSTHPSSSLPSLYHRRG